MQIKTIMVRAILSTGFMLGCLGWLIANSHTFMSRTQTDPRDLVAVLDDMRDRYHIFFSYDESIVKDRRVDFEIEKSEGFDVAIERLMTATGLGYEILSDKYCVLYSKDPRGIRKRNKLERKLRQIQKLEASGLLSVESSQPRSTKSLETSSTKIHAAELKVKHQRKAVTATIFGLITDAQTGEGLPSATVLIEGTTLGVASDLDGNYRLVGVPPGTHSLQFSYIGYEPGSLEVMVEDGQTLEQNMALEVYAVEGTEIIVTGQRAGQSAAINQQVKANSIINVVSAERIQELPDENAAESVGRLPGVSVSRSGGEGQRVNIRGLSPKFSSVSLDGVRIPATGQGRQVFSIGQGGGQPDYVPSLDDRSVDLSMISSEALAGIEVYKSLTPDQDGDAIGGKVNFITKKAPKGSKYRINAQLGRNHYHKTTENWKINGVYSNRILNDKIGVIATGGFSVVDRSSDVDEVEYEFRGGTTLTGLSISDNQSRRGRYNGSVTLDYAPAGHEFTLSGMYARTDVDNSWRNNSVNVLGNSANWSAGRNKTNINLLNLSLGSKHALQAFDLDWKVNFVQTEDETPYSYSFGFREPNPLTNVDLPQQDPYLTMEYTNFNAETATGAVPGGGANDQRLDKNWIAQVNLKRQLRISNAVNGFLKFGGKLQTKDRVRRRTNGTRMQSRLFIETYLAENPETAIDRNGISASNFLNNNLSIEPFHDEKYPFPIVLDTDAPKSIFDAYRHLRVDEIVPGRSDYEANENIYAGYFMADLNLGSRVSLVGGLRYEYSDNNYAAYDDVNYSEFLSNDGLSLGRQGTIEWVSSAQNYGELLPMVNAKVKIFATEDNSNGLDLRLATTRTITRPDYYNVTPFQRINVQSDVITRSEPGLLPTLGWNYDAFLTLFNNKFGLLTIGGFYKELENIDFLYNRILESDRIEERFSHYGISGSFSVIEPLNADGITTVKGYEVELQTNLSFLPSPFDGIVLYGNFSEIASRAVYPFRISRFNLETFKSELIDTSRILQMPGQSDQIANFSVGYDKGIFQAEYHGITKDLL